MSTKSTYKGTPPKYLNDFSKALASEVRILLQEVGKLRDERRALQFEIAELMAVKSKHGAGGEYSPDWKPKEQPAPPPAPDAPAGEPAPAPAKPAWRTVNHRKPLAHKKEKAKPPPAAPEPPPDLQKPMPSWSTWKRPSSSTPDAWHPHANNTISANPLLAPTPKAPSAPAPLPTPPPPRPNLFGED
ncbi:hypothetical protein JB92DRAFT_3133826 [Gautieria morchelliformis]|nr:hypothetical protein JB92DRAFT_3133826 [Gautieria morchelliformis]